MKHRNPLSVLLLSIITLGIYDLYWLASTSKAMNARNVRHKALSIWILLAPGLVVIAGFILTILKSAPTSSPYPGTAPVNTSSAPLIGSGLLAIGLLLAFIISFFWFWRYSKAVNEFTGGRMNFALTFLLLWVLHLIGVVFIQDAFNEQEEQAASVPPTAGMPMQPAPPQYQQPPYPTAPTAPNMPAAGLPAQQPPVAAAPPQVPVPNPQTVPPVPPPPTSPA